MGIHLTAKHYELVVRTYEKILDAAGSGAAQIKIRTTVLFSEGACAAFKQQLFITFSSFIMMEVSQMGTITMAWSREGS